MNLRLDGLSADLRALVAVWPMVFQFKLPPRAVIVVAGCYEGRVMELLGRIYPDFRRMVGFDLQSEACKIAIEKFQYSPRVEIYNIGLGTVTTLARPGRYGSVDTTLMVTDPMAPVCDVREIGSAFTSLKLTGIDLLVLNMEGYEYHLIQHLSEQHWDCGCDIDRIAVQFHPRYLSADKMFESALRLEESYRLVVDELPQWGYWRKQHIDA